MRIVIDCVTEVNLNDSSQQSRSGSDVVTRYSKIAGHRTDYAVFTSNLPGQSMYMSIILYHSI